MKARLLCGKAETAADYCRAVRVDADGRVSSDCRFNRDDPEVVRVQLVVDGSRARCSDGYCPKTLGSLRR